MLRAVACSGESAWDPSSGSWKSPWQPQEPRWASGSLSRKGGLDSIGEVPPLPAGCPAGGDVWVGGRGWGVREKEELAEPAGDPTPTHPTTTIRGVPLTCWIFWGLPMNFNLGRGSCLGKRAMWDPHRSSFPGRPRLQG